MYPAAFEYLPAHTTDEALAALLEHGADARILAGGQSLIPAMRFRLVRPTLLMDITPIGELNYLREAGGALEIGARLRRRGFARGQRALPAYIRCLRGRRRSRRSPKWNGRRQPLPQRPAGDRSVVALASRAEMVVRSKAGDRVVAIDDFLIDSFTTAVGEGEMARIAQTSRIRGKASA